MLDRVLSARLQEVAPASPQAHPAVTVVQNLIKTMTNCSPLWQLPPRTITTSIPQWMGCQVSGCKTWSSHWEKNTECEILRWNINRYCVMVQIGFNWLRPCRNRHSNGHSDSMIVETGRQSGQIRNSPLVKKDSIKFINCPSWIRLKHVLISESSP